MVVVGDGAKVVWCVAPPQPTVGLAIEPKDTFVISSPEHPLVWVEAQ